METRDKMFNLSKMFNKNLASAPDQATLTDDPNVVSLIEYKYKREIDMASKRQKEEIERDLLETWLMERDLEAGALTIDSCLQKLINTADVMTYRFSNEYPDEIKRFNKALK